MNRHVPIIIGASFLSLSVWLAIWVGGFFGIAGATVCTLFGWPSLKTGLFASNKEIDELTGVSNLSNDTIKKFQDRA